MSPRAEALNTLLLASKQPVSQPYNNDNNAPCHDDADVQLRRLEAKLTSFDPEKVYATIQEDLEEKYQLAANYYAVLDHTRDNLLNEDKLDAMKEQIYKTELREKLDVIVNALRKDFTAYIDESYALFDALFVLNTNAFSQKELSDLDDKVSRCLAMADAVYSQEHRKIEQIYDLLEDEGVRLNEALELH